MRPIKDIVYPPLTLWYNEAFRELPFDYTPKLLSYFHLICVNSSDSLQINSELSQSYNDSSRKSSVVGKKKTVYRVEKPHAPKPAYCIQIPQQELRIIHCHPKAYCVLLHGMYIYLTYEQGIRVSGVETVSLLWRLFFFPCFSVSKLHRRKLVLCIHVKFVAGESQSLSHSCLLSDSRKLWHCSA